MPIEYIESWDQGQNAMVLRWDPSSSLNADTGRFGGASNLIDGSRTVLTRAGLLSSVATRYIGFAMQNTNASSWSAGIMAQFMDSGTTQVELRTTTSGQLQVTRNGTVLGTSTNTMSVKTWYYVEWSVTVNSSTGASTVRVTAGGGTTAWLTLTGVNTQNTANATTNQVKFANPGHNWDIDDLYISTTAFLGESRVFFNLPTGDSAVNAQWTPNSGTAHFSRVNEANEDSDTSYNSSATVGQIDTYTFAGISPAGSIAAVQTTMIARKDDIGTRTLCEECRSASANYAGSANFGMTTTYAAYSQLRETDPATGAAWTVSGVNAAELGVQVLA